MAQFLPLFLDTGSIKVATGSRVADFMHFPVTASISSSYTTLLPDPYLFATMSANITNAANTTSSSLFQFVVPGRQEQYFYAQNSIVGVTTSATTTGVRIGLQSQNSADSIASIKVSSTLTAHTIANVGTLSATTFALPASMAAINTVYPCFVKGLYTNSTATTTASAELRNTILVQPETNNTVTAITASVSYNKFIGYISDIRDLSFNSGGTGTNNQVSDLVIQTDGKIIAGGLFTSYNGTTQNYITRLSPDGILDSTYTGGGTAFNSAVYTISLQADEKVIAGGIFTFFDSISTNSIIRLNTDRSRDATFNIGTGFDSLTNKVLVDSNQKVLVGGLFTTYQGVSSNFIIRLNSDGSIDTTFNTGTGFNNQVNSIAEDSNGKIIVTGIFNTYSGSTSNGIVRINSNGSKDTSFNEGIFGFSFPTGPDDIAIDSNGKIICVGNFTSYSGSTSNGIVRINSNGSKDTSFNEGTGFNAIVNSLSIDSNGKIICVGNFTSYSGSTSNRIVRINSDGSKDTSFNVEAGPNGNSWIAIPQGNKILLGGQYTRFNGVTQNNITRLRAAYVNDEKSTPLYLSTGSLNPITGSHTITASYLPVTSSLWFSQSLAANVANTSATAYATVFTLTGLTTGKRYLANLYIIGSSAAAATGFRMRVVTGSEYRGTLYTPTSTTAPAIQNSANANNITSITAGTWPTINTKYLVFGEYTFVKAAQDPQVQILSETAATAVTAFSGSVIYYRPID